MMTEPPNTAKVDLGDITNTCFVAMPFDASFVRHYKDVIKPAIEDLGMTCVRGDEVYSSQTVIADVWRKIRGSRLLVAELTGRNPNVMFEIGLAHAIGKPTVLITRSEDDTPFDLQALRYLYYDVNNPFWGRDLRRELRDFLAAVIDENDPKHHLDAIIVSAVIPDPPEPPREPGTTPPFYDLSGTWEAKWLSVVAKREHTGTLYIPRHDNQIVADLIVIYERDGVPSIV